MEFFPEVKTLQIGPLYYGTFRLFEDADWHFVLDEKKKRRSFLNSTEALSAARAECKSWMNPKIRATEKAVKSVSDALGVEAWLKGKSEEKEAANRESVKSRTITSKGGKGVVVVERRNGKTR